MSAAKSQFEEKYNEFCFLFDNDASDYLMSAWWWNAAIAAAAKHLDDKADSLKYSGRDDGEHVMKVAILLDARDEIRELEAK